MSKLVGQKGGVGLVILIILVLLTGGALWTIKVSSDSLPRESLYHVKSTIEDFRLYTSELDYIKRVTLYIEFANRRLDEIERLEEKQAPPSLLLEVVEDFWKDEQKALKELKMEHVNVEDPTEVNKSFRELRKRQNVVLKNLLNNIPNPEFYKLYQIIEESKPILEKAGF